MGYVKGGASRRQKPILQPGNVLDVEWKARLSEHLGHFRVDLHRSRALDLIDSRIRAMGFQVASEHLRLLAERQSETGIADGFEIFLDEAVDLTATLNLLVRFEFQILAILGYGLDLQQCAVTGKAEDLAYVSPKTGRAVSAAAAGPWADRLLPLPSFVLDHSHAPTQHDLLAGLKLTGHFLDRNAYGPRHKTPPEARDRLVARLHSPGTKGGG